MKCSVPQGSILGPLLFLLYINDLQFSSDLLDPIIFAEDTNLFYSNKDINTAFLKVNDELQKINEWFISKKLSLNVKKTKYSFFHKPTKTDDISLVLPKLNINNREIARTESIKFLGIFLDENLSWKTHIKYIKNKISKNIGISFKASPAGIYLLKVNNRNTRTRCEICSKLTIKTPERRLASFWCLYC